VFTLLRWSPLIPIVRTVMQRGKVTILLYHDPEPARFERHIRALKRRYAIVSLREYVEARCVKKSMDHRAPAVVLTIDDGHRGNYQLRDVIRQEEVPVTVFLASAIVDTRRHYWFLDCSGDDKDRLKRVGDAERLRRLREGGFDELAEHDERQALTAGEIKEMKSTFDFQCHTRTHPVLPNCDEQKARQEICGAREELVRRFNLDVYAFAYPNGDYSLRDVQIVRECGYMCAITLDFGFNGPTTDIFRLKRILIDDDEEIPGLLVKTSGVWGWLKRWVFFRDMSGPWDGKVSGKRMDE
jgi:peptidoglycan/xylan/chitin deacetylase (PgdA/CDA1 family)